MLAALLALKDPDSIPLRKVAQRGLPRTRKSETPTLRKRTCCMYETLFHSQLDCVILGFVTEPRAIASGINERVRGNHTT